MWSIDPILSTPLAGRSHKLQSLIRHLLESYPSLFGEMDSLIRTNKKYRIKGDHEFGQTKQRRTSTTILSDWIAFPNLSQKKQENLLEDCVVIFFRKICDNGKKTVLVHDSGSRHKSRILQFCGPDIVETLRLSGFNSWFIDASDNNDLCLSLDKASLERMNFISLILVGPWGLTLEYNTKTKTFKLPFSASLAPDWEDSILLYDFFYVPNHRTTDKLLENYKRSFPLPQDLTKHRRTFTAIPVGNLKNYRIRKARQSIKPEDRNKILFCAEAYDYANSAVKDHGIALIRKILERFPNITVVFRPHPKWVNHLISLNMYEAFCHEQRFIFDKNTSSEEIMASGCALITDGSISGLTYCMAASRPAIYFNPSQLSPHFDSNVMGFNFEDGRLFRFTSTIDETLDALEDLVADPAKEFEEIIALAENAYAHPDDGMEYLLSSIHAIVENRRLSDWKTLDVSDRKLGGNSAEDYIGLIKNDLLSLHQYPRVLDKDLSRLDKEHTASDRMMILFSDIHRYAHLQEIIYNFNALFSGIVKYGCSNTAIKMIDPLLAPIITRGDINEAEDAISKLQKAYRRITRDARKGTDGRRLKQLFQSTLAGSIQNKIRNKSKITDHELKEIRSLLAEFSLAPKAPKGLISFVNIQKNDLCEMSFSCVNCGIQQSLNVKFWFSYNATCESCGTVNHIDPFEKALPLSEAFLAQLPPDGDVVLWGAGGFYYKLMQKYDILTSKRFLLVDANDSQQGLIICKKKVHSPDVIKLNNIQTVIITTLSRKEEICANLRVNYPSVEYILVPTLDIRIEGFVPILKRI